MKKNTLGKNAILNGIKTVCSILFPFISFSYCSRVLGADALGAYSFSQSIIAYLLLVAALGIPNYAIREGAFVRKRKEKLNEFVAQIFTINCIMTVITYGILIILLISWPKLVSYKKIVVIQSVQIVLTTLGADWINSIFEDYLYLAVRYIVIQIISIVALFLFVKSPADIYVYTFISMMSNAGGNILNWRYIKKNGVKLRLTTRINLNKHFIPIFILFFNCIASTIYLNSDITMLGMYNADSIVGVYTVSSKIYSMLKTLLTSVIMVTLPRFSLYVAEKKKVEYKQTLTLVQDYLIIFTLPIAVGLFLEGDKILNIVAGSEYINGDMVVKILAIAIPFAIEACFFTYSILIPNRIEKNFLVSTVVAALLNIILNIILLPKYGIYAAAFTTLIAEFVVMCITAYYSVKVVCFDFNIKIFLQTLIGCLGIACMCILLDKTCMSDNIKLIIEIFISALTYVVILIISKCDLVVNLIYKIKNTRFGNNN